MSIIQRQHDLIKQINEINDENILIMLKNELDFCLHNKNDLTDDLTASELKELITLAKDTSDKNTVSLNEFINITEQWRIK